MLELIKSGVWDRWMKRDYFRNYSNFCILDFLLILTLKYINYIFNTKRHSDTFKHVANFFDIFTDPQLRDRHKTIDTTSFDRFRKLCASNRRGTRKERFLPLFFLYQSHCPSGHQLLFDHQSFYALSLAISPRPRSQWEDFSRLGTNCRKQNGRLEWINRSNGRRPSLFDRLQIRGHPLVFPSPKLDIQIGGKLKILTFHFSQDILFLLFFFPTARIKLLRKFKPN